MSTDELPAEHRTVFLGHRGTRIYAPENTFSAFDVALEHGCDGFELDVRRTSDGLGVICHDPDFCGLTVADSTLTQLQLRHQLPTLTELLQRYCSKAFINIELKVPGLEAETIVLLRRYPCSRGVLVSSFLPEVVEALHPEAKDLNISIGYICCDAKKLGLWRTLPISHAILHFSLVSNLLHQEIVASEKKLFVWTVNDAAEVERFTNMAVDGIISDDTKLCLRARSVASS